MINGAVDSDATREPSHRLRVEEVMGPALTVTEEKTVRDVAAVMLARQVQAVLVVDAQAKVVGTVTEGQLTLNGNYMRLACAEVPEIDGRSVTTLDEVDAACIAASTLTARDVMERSLLSVGPDEPVAAVVERMLRRGAHCAVVQHWGAVVGMLGSHDLLRIMAGDPPSVRKPTDTRVNGQSVHIGSNRDARQLTNWFSGLWR
jgi:CBS domain-containing protein